jgi:hypothetical protein
MGRPNEALDMLRLAHYGAQGTATATVTAMLHVTSARAYARAGQEQNCLSAIGHAEEAYASSQPDIDPPWIQYYTSAQLAGDSGNAIFDAAQSDPSLRTQALVRLVQAADSYGPSYPRSAAFCLVRSAAIHFDNGEHQQGVADTDRFIELADAIVSERLTADRQMLMHHARPHLALPEVADVQQRLTRGPDHA